MDYQIFLRELRLTPRDWFLTANGQIRYPADQDRGLIPLGDGYPACPLNRLRDLHQFMWNPWTPVARAADNQPDHDPAVRAELLTACGLTES